MLNGVAKRLVMYGGIDGRPPDFDEDGVRTELPTGVMPAPVKGLPNVTRKNHFVPCFYSSLWTGEDGRLCEFSRPYKRVEPQRKHPKATGYQRDLYTEAALPSEVRTYLEDAFLKLVDQRGFDALQFILANRISEMDSDHRSAWARFIMSMLHRSPGKIAELRERWRGEYQKPHEEFEAEYQALRQPTDPLTMAEAIEQTSERSVSFGQLRVLQMVMDLPKVGTQIVNMRWGVLTITGAKYKFLTSDRPIIMTNGLGIPEGHVALPIGPQKLFLAANRQETIDKIIKGANWIQLIRFVNLTVIKQAERYVYGDTDKALSFVENHLRRQP